MADRRGRKRSVRGRRERERGFFRRFWWLWTPPVAIALTLAGALTYVYVRLPLPEAPPRPESAVLYDRYGDVLATLHAGIDRTEIPFSDMPIHLREAVIATEDADFYRHYGVSLLAILRAAWTNVTSGQIEQGGSTITQQYVKNVYTGSERSLVRKLEEALLAVKLERRLTKDQILKRYLNTIYFGHGAYGVEAAAQTYFGRRAKGLTVLQSATLAGLISSPARLDPVRHPNQALDRRNHVLERMAALGFLRPSRAADLADEPVDTLATGGLGSGPAAYFVDYTKTYLEREFGTRRTFTGGLRVRTGLDPGWQRAAEDAVLRHLGLPGDPAVALVAIDPANGQVRAMVGGRDFRQAKVNLATGKGGSGRQAGSAFKTFTLAAAVEEGIALSSRFAGPSRIRIDECGGWEPENYGDASYGGMDLVEATARSVNTVFAQLVAEVGPGNVVDVAGRLGIKSSLDPVCSITLGTEEVNPLEMTAAYAVLAAGGAYHPPKPYRVVKTVDGEVLDRARRGGIRVMDPNDAAQVTYALERVVDEGTGVAAAFGAAGIAGKTGTTDDNADAWFCGYTPLLATCVWVGYPEGRVPMTNVHGSRVTGGSFPARIWHDFMVAAHAGLDVPAFPEPEFTGEAINAVPDPGPSPTPSP